MDFLKGLASYAGELKANVREPLYKLEQEYRKRQLADALNQVIELDQKRRQSQNPQVPLRPTTFGRGDELLMAQQMKLAGIDPGAIAQDKMAAERLSMLREARQGIDSPYALGNMANELDASPVRASSGTFYNRFDIEKPILAMTDAVRADGQSKSYKARMDKMRLGQLAKMMGNDSIPEFLKTDALNNKAITKTDRVKIIKDGKEVYADAMLTPSGWRYAPAMDAESQPLRVPQNGEATTLAKNLRLVARTWKMPEEEALGFLLLSKQKSPAQMRNDLMVAGAKNPLMAGDIPAITKFADDMISVMYPEEQGKEQAPASSPAQSKAPPQQLITQAIQAINQGAPREAVMARIAEQGYSTEGLDL